MKHNKSKADRAAETVADVAEPAPAPAEAPADTAATPAEASAPAADDRLLRLQADFDNFRKRTARERAEISQRANEELLLELLPVLDHLELGIATAREHHSDSAVMQGFQLVYEQFVAALKKFGLTPIQAVGQPFDPHAHEAAAHLPSAEHPEHQVVSQIRGGYRLGDRLLRPAQVVVSSGPPPAAGGPETAAG